MSGRELNKLSRAQLLEMLLDAAKENDSLREEVAALKAQLDERRITIEQSGSLAEAALKLSGIFEAADEAVKIYTESIKKLSGEENR